MPVGRLGNQLGNIVLGYGARQAVITSTSGVAPGQVGTQYDFALGYDPGIGSATMVGYMIGEGKEWSEGTQLQQIQQLVSVASPNLVDRNLTFWPKVSQGDWSGGERQLIFGISNISNRYFLTDGGIDTSVPAGLTLMPSATATFTQADAGVGVSPLAGDGASYYLGVTGANLYIVGNAATNAYHIPAASTHEIFSLLSTPYGIFAGSQDGIFNVTPTGSYTQWTNDPISSVPGRSIAYFNNLLFYITSGEQKLNSLAVAAGAAPGTTVFTLGSATRFFEPHFSCVASTANGLFLSTWREASASNATAISVLYTSDGVTMTRIGDVLGQVMHAHEMNGVLYILVYGSQQSIGDLDYTLYTYTGGTLATLDDLRYVIPDFMEFAPGVQPTTVKVYLSGDGRFLYISWPGLQALRYDTMNSAFQKVGTNAIVGASNITSHRTIPSQGLGIIDSYTANGTVYVTRYGTLPPASGATGQLVTSYYDFATPGLNKYMRTFEVEMASPLPLGAMVTVEYQLDSGTVWAPLPVQASSIRLLTGFFTHTKATRVRFRLTLTAGPGGSPVIRSTAAKATLGRVWTTTAVCNREQKTRNGELDNQGLKSQDLIANIYQAYQNSGNCTLYFPSPSQAGGVETALCIVEDYKWHSTKGGPDPGDQGQYQLEGEVDVTLVEN